ncbi:MAG TPA: hypothetical protein VHK24_15485 [Steroidobacter sp.]|jgi:hypothetical protein|nr:hypothetical protein [Steroidobacter sp.]
MNVFSEKRATPAESPRSRFRFELIFASLWLAFGLFVLPALIYSIGQTSLGPYGENASAGDFYAAFFRDLAEPSGRPWAIALGPLALVWIVRAIFIGVGRAPAGAHDASHNESSRSASEPHRIEPRVSLD